MTLHAKDIKNPPIAVFPLMVYTTVQTPSVQLQVSQKPKQKPLGTVHDFEEEVELEYNAEEDPQEEIDPLGDVPATTETSNYSLTSPQKKATESGLVYRIIVKDGHLGFTKVSPNSTSQPTIMALTPTEEEEELESCGDIIEINEAEETETIDTIGNAAIVDKADENSSSFDKTDIDKDSNSETEDETKTKTKTKENKKCNEKKSVKVQDQSSSPKERRSPKVKEIAKDVKSKSSSSSSNHRSTSSHKSSSLSLKSSISYSSKSKLSSSSSSSGDKYKSSSKDNDCSGSSSSTSSKHRSLSSKSSSSSLSRSKDKYRDNKEKSSSTSKVKDKLQPSQAEIDKATLDKVTLSTSSLAKLGRIPKKPKENTLAGDMVISSNKPTSVVIPSKKAYMSIEIRKDSDKSGTVKTYKSQFRSHGLTEEAPPPPLPRKNLKNPSSKSSGTVLPLSLPSSLKRTSSPPKYLLSEKRLKIDINNVTVANEKPGAIKLIPPKNIQTLLGTNLFSGAFAATARSKNVTKPKIPTTDNDIKVPTSRPEAPNIMPIKFSHDTLDELISDKENDNGCDLNSLSGAFAATTKPKNVNKPKIPTTDNDMKVPTTNSEAPIIMPIKFYQDTLDELISDDAKSDKENDDPNGPSNVLLLHSRKVPKMDVTRHTQETLKQARYFKLDEIERCNVAKTSFKEKEKLERLNERHAIIMERRNCNRKDNMEPQTHWRVLIELEDVPPHPEGNQSKQRKIQAERELTTLKALYITHAHIPDSPAEAEIEVIFNNAIPLIPLDDIMGNSDAVMDITSMAWPEPKGSSKQGDNIISGTGGLESPLNMFGKPASNNNKGGNGGKSLNPFDEPPKSINHTMGKHFNGSTIMDMPGPGYMNPVSMMNNGHGAQNGMKQLSPPLGVPPNNLFNGGPLTELNFGPAVTMGTCAMMGNNGFPMNNNRGKNFGYSKSVGSYYQDNNGGEGYWWPASHGQNFGGNGDGGGGGNSNNNSGICKAFMRGYCRVNKFCKYIHPNKNKRL